MCTERIFCSNCRLCISMLMMLTVCGNFTATAQKKYLFEYAKMGSPFVITICTKDSAAAAIAAQAAALHADSLISSFSDYIDSSELNRLCAHAGDGKFIAVSEPLFDILQVSLTAAELSKGSFDISLGPVIKLWRQARKSQQIPSKNAIRAALKKTGYRYIHLDSLHRSIMLEHKGMQLDLGALGKGYVAQAAWQVLANNGFPCSMVNAGGKIVTGDAPPGSSGWKIGIKIPGEEEAILDGFLFLKNTSVATSGDVYQHLDYGGKRYSHIIDPKTGYGILQSRNVTVIANDGVISDWLATACSILTPKKAMALVAKFQDAALLITGTEKGKPIEYRSPQLKNFLRN